MKNKNNKGFTLVEVLAVVIILGIVLASAIVGYSKYIEKTKKNYYSSQEKLLTQAGRDFFNDNRGFLPVDIGAQNCVLLKTLIDNKYIDPVKDYNKENCSKENSRVCAQKISLTSYKYETQLVCNNDMEIINYDSPTIKFKIDNDDFSEGKTVNAKDKTYTVDMIIEDENFNLSGYKYVIKKGNNTYLTKSGIIKKNNKKYTVSIPMNSSGTYKIEAEAYNEKGKRVSVTSGTIKLEFSKINCSGAIVFDPETNNWISNDITVRLLADDLVDHYKLELKDASTNKTIKGPIEVGKLDKGYTNDIANYSDTIHAEDNKSLKVYYKVIPYDKDNKNYSCTVKSEYYKIDKGKPSIIFTSTNNVAIKQTATIILKDNNGLKEYYFGTDNPNNKAVSYTAISGNRTNYTATKPVTNGGTYYISVVDKAGNTTTIEKNFYKTTLSLKKGSVSPTSIITMEGKEFNLPTPTINTSDQFDGWYKENTYTTKVASLYKPTASTTLYGKWNEINTTTTYKVNHYIHDLGSNTYTLESTETKSGESNSTITLANLKKTIPGFTYVDGYLTGGTTKPTEGAVTTTTVLADGSRVINLYYRRNYLYVQYHVNGGSMASNHGAGYGVSNSLVTYTGNTTNTNFLRGVYGSKVGTIGNMNTYLVNSNGLNDYNNEFGITFSQRHVESGKEWNTKADGTGISYNQSNTTYNADGFAGADLSTGDKTVTIYVNWKANIIYTITLDKNGATNTPTSNLTVESETSTLYGVPITLPEKKYKVSGFYINDDNDYDDVRHSNGARVTSSTALESQAPFNGWYTNANGGLKVLSEDTTPVFQSGVSGYTSSNGYWLRTQPTTLYAQFGNQSSVQLPEITKTGYTCGWTESSDGTTIQFASGEFITPLEKQTLYGVCIEKAYALVVNGNGGKIGENSSIKYTPLYGELKKINNPTRTGYVFAGWSNYHNLIQKPYYNSSIDTNFSNSIADVTAYDDGITVNRYNNSSFSSSLSQSPVGNYVISIVQNNNQGSTHGMGGFYQRYFPVHNHTYLHVIIANVGKGNYLHFNYNTPENIQSSEWLTSNEGVGNWRTYIYKIKYKSSGDLGSFGYVYYSNKSERNLVSETGKFSSKLAYSAVLDITDNDNGIGQLKDSLSDPAILNAIWTPGVYTISLNNQGANKAGTTEIYEKYNTGYYRDYNNGVTSTPMQKEGDTNGTGITRPIKNGYKFLGYYTGTNGSGNKYIDEDGILTTSASPTKFSSNGTLYANWTYGQYLLTFDKQGGTGGSDYMYEKYNTGFYQWSTLENQVTTSSGLNIPSLNNYNFLGYYTGTNGTGKQIITSAGKLVSGVSPTTFITNTTLYAKWQQKVIPPSSYSCEFLYDVCSINVSHSGEAHGWGNNVKNGWCEDTFLDGVFYCTKGTILGKSVAATSGTSTCNSLSNSSGTIGWNYTAELSGSGSWGNCKCSTTEKTFTTGYIATYTTKPTKCPDYLSKLGSSCRPNCK